jgi:RND family efflux transporter MFP subunit
MKRPQWKCVASSLVGLVALIILLGGCGKEEVEEAAPVVRPVKSLVVTGGAGMTMNFPATVEAGRRTLLSFRVPGQLSELNVREGDQVEQNQVIARLDPKDYQHALDEARAEYERAEADFRRYQRLYERDAVPLADLDLRRSQRDVASARLADARTSLGYTTLRAPFAGQIGNRYVENFQEVVAQQDIVDLNNTSEVELKIDLPENITKILSQEAKSEIYAVFEVLPSTRFPLTVKEVSTRADPQTQTFRATLVMPQPEELRLLPGMTGEVVLETMQTDVDLAEGSMLVPAIAVIPDERGQNFVWVIDPAAKTVSRRDVQVGQLRGVDLIEIHSGLVDGEEIAISGVTKLREGMVVTIWDPFGKGSTR